MKVLKIILITIGFFLTSFNHPSHALILINEFLADPSSDISGDANHDGIRSSSDDEFIELVNTSDQDFDLVGWSLYDATSRRHLFPTNSLIPAYKFFVVFGGGDPQLPGINFQTASTGTLSLNNTLDSIFLYDSWGSLIDSVTFGAEGNLDSSLTRYPDGEGQDFLLHTSLSQANGAKYSPGLTVEGETELPQASSVGATSVPEVSSILYFSLMGFMVWRRKNSINLTL